MSVQVPARMTSPSDGNREPFVNSIMERADALWHLFVKELMKFGVVGALAFVINAVLVLVLMHTPWFEDSHIKAKFVATVVAILFSWVANRLWTFREKRQADKRRELVQFLVANGIGLGIEMGCLFFSYYVLGLQSATASFISGTIIGTILGTIFRYFAYRFWVFRQELDEDPDFAGSREEEFAFITGQIPVVQRKDETAHQDSDASSRSRTDSDAPPSQI